MAFHHVARSEQLFSVAINDVAHKEQVSQKLVSIMQEASEGPFCSKDCCEAFLRMFVRIRLLRYLRMRNRDLSKVKESK